MKNLTKLFLITALLLGSKAALADTNWGPAEVHNQAVAACQPIGDTISDDPEACGAAMNACVTHFIQCVHQCPHAPDYYNDQYYYCSDAVVSQCKQQADSDYHEAIKDGGACDYNPSQPKFELSKVHLGNILNNNTITAKLPENLSVPEIADSDNADNSGGNSPADQTETPELEKTGIQNIPAGVPAGQAVGGSGCSFSGLAQGQGGIEGLYYGLLALLPALRAKLRRK